MSEICSAFGCTPLEAERQDPRLVTAILDYRNAKVAHELLNDKDQKHAFDMLTKQPELLRLIARLRRAQMNEHLDAPGLEAEGAIIAEAQRQIQVNVEVDGGMPYPL